MTTINLSEIKKALYKEKPVAKIFFQDGVSSSYGCDTSLGRVLFYVPYSEMGETEFKEEMPAQLLIRWIKPDRF